MKKYILMPLMLVVLLAGAALQSCSDSATEKQLDGRWYGKTSFIDDEGDACTLKIEFDLDASNHRMEMEMTQGMVGEGDIVAISLSGTWKADPETLWLTFEGTPEVRFTSNARAAASYSGVSLSDIERQMTNMIKDEIGGMDFMDIKKLSGDRLVLDIGDLAADGTDIVMNRR